MNPRIPRAFARGFLFALVLAAPVWALVIYALREIADGVVW